LLLLVNDPSGVVEADDASGLHDGWTEAVAGEQQQRPHVDSGLSEVTSATKKRKKKKKKKRKKKNGGEMDAEGALSPRQQAVEAEATPKKREAEVATPKKRKGANNKEKMRTPARDEIKSPAQGAKKGVHFRLKNNRSQTPAQAKRSLRTPRPKTRNIQAPSSGILKKVSSFSTLVRPKTAPSRRARARDYF